MKRQIEVMLHPAKAGGFGHLPPCELDEFEEWKDVHIDANLITREFVRPSDRLDLSFPLCHYELRGKVIFVPRKHPEWTSAPRWIEFRPKWGRDWYGEKRVDTFTAWAFPARMPPLCLGELCHRATASDIAGVVGSSFYTNDTLELSGTTLKAWLDGFITQHEAATFGSKQLKQIGVVFPPRLTQPERQLRPRRSSDRMNSGVSAPEFLL